MYINTRSKKDIEKSLCQVLNINKERLYRSMEECYNLFQKDHQIFVLDDQFDFFYKFVEKNQVEAIDQVMFIHLSRRLKGDEDNNGTNSFDTPLIPKAKELDRNTESNNDFCKYFFVSSFFPIAAR